MILLFAILAFFHLGQSSYVVPLKSIWSERCTKKSWILNDCNWCKCDKSQRYLCEARPCSAVDMFGHFKDAISPIVVGMEGHGAWRSTRTACTPGVSYRRDGLLCICDEDGEWPNKVCKNKFRVLYSVEPTELKAVTGKETCEPNKLYLVGCNVCPCPHSGRFDESLCTNMKCQPDDPILEGEIEEYKTVSRTDEKIYATCDINKEYLLGCRRCLCSRNNRLRCNNCSEKITKDMNKSYCDHNKIGDIFNIDCNTCQCDAMKNMFCTAKNCLQRGSKVIRKIIDLKREMKDGSYDICTSKQYEKGCHSCTCIKNEMGNNIVDCSTKCDTLKRTIHDDCVNNTVYEWNCQVCYCYMRSDEKREFCISNPICHTDKVLKERRSQDLKSMHGYCEPLHTYKKDCNVCQCLADGQTLKCTSTNCRVSKSVTVDSMVPVRVKGNDCPKGHSYKVDCNICFCLLNGNSICTTVDCRKGNNKI